MVRSLCSLFHRDCHTLGLTISREERQHVCRTIISTDLKSEIRNFTLLTKLFSSANGFNCRLDSRHLVHLLGK